MEEKFMSFLFVAILLSSRITAFSISMYSRHVIKDILDNYKGDLYE